MVKTALTLSMTARPLDPRSFGRRRPFLTDAAVIAARPPLSDDLKLFAVTWLGGFLMVSIFLA